MVNWSTEQRPVARQPRTRRASGLGPQARGIFDRLFGAAPVERALPPPHLEALSIAITSGKGGTGKSFLATNLAVLLHRAGCKITLVDCDFGLACDHLLLGVSPKKTLQHLVTGQATIRDIRIPTPAGPALVPGASGVRSMADLADHELLALGRGLAELAASSDVLLLDIGAGISPQNVLTMLCADHLVLVVEPEIAALTDAYAVIKCIAQLRPNASFSVVVNRVTAPHQGERTFEKLAEVATKYVGVRLVHLGDIASDPTVTQRRLGQLPMSVTDPKGVTTRAIGRVLQRLESAAGPFSARRVEAAQALESRFQEHRLFLC